MDPPSWLDPSLYPFAPRFFPAGQGRMHYVDVGQGPPVVLLHGNPTWSFLYRDLICHLAPAHRCVAPDYLGFGLSEKPPGFSYAPPEHAACVHALIDSLGLEDLTLVMHDWGGPIGLSYALKRPDNVRRLVILNTWMWPLRAPHVMLFSKAMGSAPGRFLTERHNVFARFIMPLVFGDRARLTPEVHRHYLRPLGPDPACRTGSWVFPRALLGASTWLGELWTQRHTLRGKPALLVWGMKDPAFGTRTLWQWTNLLPEAEVWQLPSVGHYVPEEAASDLAPLVERFLRRSA